MVKDLNEHMVETLHSNAKRSVSKRNFDYYMLELEIIRDVKKKFMKDFKEVLKDDKPTSIHKDLDIKTREIGFQTFNIMICKKCNKMMTEKI